jgi:hypothetical protein
MSLRSFSPRRTDILTTLGGVKRFIRTCFFAALALSIHNKQLSCFKEFSLRNLPAARLVRVRSRVRTSVEVTSVLWYSFSLLLTDAAGPVRLVLDLRIVHDRFGSRSDPSLKGHLHCPNDIDKSLNESVTEKIRKYRSDYNNKQDHLFWSVKVQCWSDSHLDWNVWYLI